MEKLTRELVSGGFTFPENVEVGEVVLRPEKVLQFGEGNFLRAFVDWMIDKLNTAGEFNGNVVVAQPIKNGLVDMLNDQDGLYTLLLRGVEDGEVKESRRVVTSISRGVKAYDEWSELVAIAESADLRFVFSNTTEAGICHEEEAYNGGDIQETFPAKITTLLYKRFQAKQGGLVFIPCELIDRNGDNLKKYVIQYATEWNLGDDFIEWIKAENVFANTLVDRIVPGYPREEVEQLTAELGYKDNLIDTGEIFHLWVIEAPQELAEELPFHKAGLNVVWTDNMEPYRTRKVRVLNGAHTSSVLASFQAGLETVGEMMADDTCGKFLRKVVFEEILPELHMDEDDKQAYAGSVMERFCNPFIKHALISISLNSVSKWKVRVMPSFLDSLESTGKIPAAMAFSLAALIRFYDGKKSGERELTGSCNGADYPIRDDEAVLDFMEAAWGKVHAGGSVADLVASILSNESFWGRDLSTISGLAEMLTGYLESILADGIRSVLEKVIE